MSRPTLKVRLSDTGSAWEAMQIVSAWRKARQSARHVANAIRLYASLVNGRADVLGEMFPWTGLMGKSAHVSTPVAGMGIIPAAAVILEEPDAEDAANDFMSSLGL